jgi:hypothetical protein
MSPWFSLFIDAKRSRRLAQIGANENPVADADRF